MRDVYREVRAFRFMFLYVILGLLSRFFLFYLYYLYHLCISTYFKI